ncbi:hypothetical protein PFISCL1PPCAC_18629, partial [Pristionchus fissidentatus]
SVSAIFQIIRALLLLLSIVLLTQTREYKIDLERCIGKNPDYVRTCFMRKSCLTPTASSSGDDQNVLAKLETNAILTHCDVIVQIRAFNRSKSHIMMQVNGTLSNAKLDFEKGMEIFQAVPQLSCSASGIKTNPKLAGQYGTRQVFTHDLIFCSVTL